MHSIAKRIGILGLATRMIAALVALLAAAHVAAAATNPWTLISSSASSPSPNWSPPNQGSGSYPMPAVGDLNGDGLPDLLFGLANGTLVAYQNTGTASAPAWTAVPGWGTLTSPCTIGGNTETYFAPALADLNGDGLLDLVLGARDGICIYQNTGTTSAPIWTQNANTISWVQAFGTLTTSKFYSVGLGDIDNDGHVDVMVFSQDGAAAYRNTDTGSAPNLSPNWVAHPAWNGLYQSWGVTGALIDMDGDHLADLVEANAQGNVQFFKNMGTNTAQCGAQFCSAGNWSPAIASTTTPLISIGIAFGDLNGDGKADLVYSTFTLNPVNNNGPTAVYEQNVAGMPAPDYASGPPTGGTTVLDTFDSFSCTGSWVVAATGPTLGIAGTYTSYSRDCGNGWTAFAEDNLATSLTPYPYAAGGVGNQNLVQLDTSANGPSAAPSTPLGAGETGGNPDSARGVLWLLKSFPVVANGGPYTVQADFRIGADASDRGYGGMAVFDGLVSNPSGPTDSSGDPLRSDLLSSNMLLDGPSQCTATVSGTTQWCPWHQASFTVLPRSGYITVAVRIQDIKNTDSFYIDVDNLKVSGVQNATASALPATDIAQLWSANYQPGTTNSGGQLSRSAVPKAVKTDAAGNVYVAADSNNGSNYDIVAIKYDPSGNLLWKATYDGGDSDQAAAMAVDGSGNVYVTGRSYNTANSSDDYVVVKFNSSGTQVWATRFDNAGRTDDPSALALDGSGNAYVTGSSCNGSSDCKYFTIVVNGGTGVQQWQAIYDNTGNSLVNNAAGIALDSAGNVYVSGTSSAGSYDDIATLKYNSSGTQLRENRYDTGYDNRAVAMAADSAGDVYITGYTFAGGNLTILTLKYAAAAVSGDVPLWVKTYLVSNLAQPAAMALDSSGNVYVTGFSGAPGSLDWITLKYLNNGDLAWAQTFGNPNVDDKAANIAVDASGNVFVVGSVTPSTGNTVYALVKYDSSGIARSEITYQGLTTTSTVATTNLPVAIALGQDSQLNAIPIVTGVTQDPSGFTNVNTVLYVHTLPDLTMSALSGPTSATVGNSITVNNTVLNILDLANRKDSPSGPFTVALYLAPDVGGLADMNHLVSLGTRNVANLNPGQSSSDSTVVTIPTSTAEGNYFLVAMADSTGAVLEADETNNTMVLSQTIAVQGILPDLAVPSVTGPSTAQHGVAFTVNVTIADLVSTPVTSSFRVGIYYSTSPTITTGSSFLTSYTVASLAGNSSQTTAVSVTIPTSGTYYIGAIADDQNVITEVNENNNTGLMTNNVSSSTLLVTKSDFLAGLPGTNVGVVVTNGAANVRLAQAPQWTAKSTWNLPSVGTNLYAKPALGDLNGDGTVDVLVGDSNGVLHAFQNNGSTSAPSWVAGPSSWSTLTAGCTNPGSGGPETYFVPKLVDLNGDGLLDLVIGTRDNVCIFQNTGSATAPTWTRADGTGAAGHTASGQNWEAGLSSLAGNNFYAPALADLNNDGKPDLILGRNSTSTLAFQNTGSTALPSWTAAGTAWQITGLLTGTRYSPALADLDGDGNVDLMLGDTVGNVVAYRNAGSTSSGPSWPSTATSAWSLTDPNYASGSDYAGPVLADINGDGSIDMLYGDYTGVTYAFQNTGPFASPGTYLSKVVDSGSHGAFTTLAYTAVVPSGTTLTVDIRAGNTATPDSTWTPWLTGIANGGDISTLGTNRYVQYRFNYATSNTAVSASLFNIQANFQTTATALPVAIDVGGGSGGGGLSAVDIAALGIFLLFISNLRRRTPFTRVD